MTLTHHVELVCDSCGARSRDSWIEGGAGRPHLPAGWAAMELAADERAAIAGVERPPDELHLCPRCVPAIDPKAAE